MGEVVQFDKAHLSFVQQVVLFSAVQFVAAGTAGTAGTGAGVDAGVSAKCKK